MASSAQPAGTAWERARHLRHGINASEWFAQSKDYSPQRLGSYTTLDDIAKIRQMGFDHVRLSIDPVIFDCPTAWEQCERVQILDQVIRKALTLELAVILDMHPGAQYKNGLAASDNAVEQFAILWGRIAAYYATLDAEHIFFEALNEPELGDVFRWAGIEQRVVAEIRRNAPQHTILVAGANYSDIPDLVRLPQFADGNLIFVFHYYEPHIFTHQGASWGEAYWNTLRQVPFPAAADPLNDATRKQTDDYARWKLMQYGLDHWDLQRIDGEIRFAAQWARQRNVPLICDEFGVYRYFARPEDRERWLGTVRSILEQNRIGWTMWDYQGGFGVVSKDTGSTVEDEGVLKALGLTK
jgi:aryl-phospho-beta-D-glucosidase BglC (GH1 family)